MRQRIIETFKRSARVGDAREKSFATRIFFIGTKIKRRSLVAEASSRKLPRGFLRPIHGTEGGREDLQQPLRVVYVHPVRSVFLPHPIQVDVPNLQNLPIVALQ